MFMVLHVGISNLALTFALYLEGKIPDISIKWRAIAALTSCALSIAIAISPASSTMQDS